MTKRRDDLSIGDVAKATGLSVYTLRQWERRYGYPKSIRRDSGHRRYEETELTRLKLVAQALELGYRAHKVVPMGSDDLVSLLKKHSGEKSDLLTMNHWIEAAESMNKDKIISTLQTDWTAFGPIGFVEYRVGPFLQRVGLSWHFNEISDSQEHFFSNVLLQFLSDKWASLNSSNSGRTFLVATLQGEDTMFGSQSNSLVLAAAGKKVEFFGSEKSIRDLIARIKVGDVGGICLGFSSNFSTTKAKKKLQKLQAQLPSNIQILVGGNGAPEDLEETFCFKNYIQLFDWLKYENKTQDQVTPLRTESTNSLFS